MASKYSGYFGGTGALGDWGTGRAYGPEDSTRDISIEDGDIGLAGGWSSSTSLAHDAFMSRGNKGKK